jgi:predicted nucleotidyltransferase
MSARKKPESKPAHFFIITPDHEIVDYGLESYDEAVDKAKDIVEDEEGEYTELFVLEAVAKVTITPKRAEVEAL